MRFREFGRRNPAAETWDAESQTFRSERKLPLQGVEDIDVNLNIGDIHVAGVEKGAPSELVSRLTVTADSKKAATTESRRREKELAITNKDRQLTVDGRKEAGMLRAPDGSVTVAGEGIVSTVHSLEPNQVIQTSGGEEVTVEQDGISYTISGDSTVFIGSGNQNIIVDGESVDVTSLPTPSSGKREIELFVGKEEGVQSFDLSTRKGDITLDGVSGNADLDVGGNVDVTTFSGSLSIRGKKEITAQNVSGQLKAVTTEGNIAAEGLSGIAQLVSEADITVRDSEFLGWENVIQSYGHADVEASNDVAFLAVAREAIHTEGIDVLGRVLPNEENGYMHQVYGVTGSRNDTPQNIVEVHSVEGSATLRRKATEE